MFAVLLPLSQVKSSWQYFWGAGASPVVVEGHPVAAYGVQRKEHPLHSFMLDFGCRQTAASAGSSTLGGPSLPSLQQLRLPFNSGAATVSRYTRIVLMLAESVQMHTVS